MTGHTQLHCSLGSSGQLIRGPILALMPSHLCQLLPETDLDTGTQMQVVDLEGDLGNTEEDGE